MSTDVRTALTDAVLRLLRPLARILLRNGFSYGDFADLAKWVFVDVAARELTLPERKQSASRIAIITGLTRKEVSHLLKEAGDAHGALAERQYNRAARVLTGWIRDSRFLGADGQPAVLPVEGDGASFAALVREHSGDMPVRAILDELVRVGAVTEAPPGQVCLLERAYVPRTGETDKLHILGTDSALLLETIDHNLRHGGSDPRFQRKVSYDNLPAAALPELRRLSAEKGQQLLEELDAYLARHDRDANPGAQGEGRWQAGVGVFYFARDLSEERRDG